MDAVLLDGAGDADQVLVDHGHEGDAMAGCECAEELVEGFDIVGAVVGRQSDTGQQNLDVRSFESGEDLAQVAAGLIEGQAAEAVVAAELDDDDIGVQAQEGWQAGDSVFRGGSAGAAVDDFVVVTLGVELTLEGVREGLAIFETVTGGNAVAVTDQDARRSGGKKAGQQQQAN